MKSFLTICGALIGVLVVLIVALLDVFAGPNPYAQRQRSNARATAARAASHSQSCTDGATQPNTFVDLIDPVTCRLVTGRVVQVRHDQVLVFLPIDRRTVAVAREDVAPTNWIPLAPPPRPANRVAVPAATSTSDPEVN